MSVNKRRRLLQDSLNFPAIRIPLLAVSVISPLVMLALPLVEKQIVDDAILGHQLHRLPLLGAWYAGFWILSLLLGTLSTLLNTYLGEQIWLDLQHRLFKQSERLSLAFSHREHSGQTMALFQNDAPVLGGLLGSTTTSALSTIVVLLVSSILMFGLSLQLALAVAVVPAVVAGLALIVTRPMRPAMRRAQEQAAALTERLQENLAGVREVVAFGREQSQGERFVAALRQAVRLHMRLTYMDAGFQAGQSLFSMAITLAVLGYGGYLVAQGKTTLGALFAIRTLFSYLYVHLGRLFGLVNGVQKSLASAERVYAFLDKEPRVVERPAARPLLDCRGEVVFEGVSFSYRKDQEVLHQVSLAARPGELVALVGPSGAGKTTLAGLIARFYDPDSGRVLLDGTDVREFTLHGLRSQIGIVFQDTFLFATTIRENIAFGREGATEAEIVAAARAAHAWEFIERLPEGLDTPTGERGAQLSEGQKQRLSVARVLLRNPRILVLDEPTSALDARSEHLLQAALTALTRGRTTFVIAHRLSTIRRADRILVLDEGRIVQQGTHTELLGRPGLYRELCLLQFGPENSVELPPERDYAAPLIAVS